MTNSATSTGSLPLTQYRRFESFKEYEALIDDTLPHTEAVVRVFDNALPASWNSTQRTSLLRHFLRRNPVNRVYIVLHETDSIERKLPRLADLCRDFGHACKIRLTPKMARHIYDPFVIFDASHYLHRFHHAHMRAAQGIHDVEGAQQLLDRHAELWEVSAAISVGSPGGL
jgi:hypothetical protein